MTSFERYGIIKKVRKSSNDYRRKEETELSIIYEHWKYIVKHIWFVLPFALIPSLFLALTIDYAGIAEFFGGLFTGKPVTDFSDIYSVWSLIDFDSALKIIYGVCAILTTIVAVELLLAFVEKHMRIGKRTLSGLWEQFFGHVLPVLFTILLAFAAYEIWALVLSAMLYAVAAIESAVAVALLSFLVIMIFLAVMVYVISIFYLWLPCMLMTGFGPYHALLYSYQLVVGVREKLILSILMSFVPALLLFLGISFLPTFVATIFGFIFIVVLFLSFCVRMETFYFETDKLDREDLLRSYLEL